MSETKCSQPDRDARMLEAITNASIIYYGPHECDLCGAKNIVRGSIKDGFGDIRIEYPISEIIYPNHNWVAHQCKK